MSIVRHVIGDLTYVRAGATATMFALVLLAVCVLTATGATAADQPVVPSAEAVWSADPVTIDGQLDDPCWAKAPKVTQFWLVDGSAQRDDLAWVKVAYDQQHLYVAYHISADKASGLRTGTKTRDGGLWGGPGVQVFIQPTAGAGYCDFMLNPVNTQEDSKNGDNSWDCRWTSATVIADDESYWQAEMAFPYAAFNKPGPDWRLNLTCVVMLADKRYILTWGPAVQNFHNPASFGKLSLKQVQWENWAYSLSATSMPGEAGALAVIVEAQGHHLPSDCLLELAALAPDGTTISKNGEFQKLQREQQLRFSFPIKEQGRYSFIATLKDKKTKRVLAERRIAAATGPPFEAWMDRSLFTSQEQATLTVIARRGGMAAETCDVLLRDSEGKTAVERLTVAFDADSKLRVALNIANLPEGKYTALVLPAGGDPANPENIYITRPLRKLAPSPGTTSYDDRGVIYKDDKPFFPIGMYYIEQHLDNGLLEEYAEAGFNTIVSEWSDHNGYINRLKQTAPHGVHLMVSIQNEYYTWQMRHKRNSPADEIASHIANVIKQVADTRPSNLLAWYIIDEPGLSSLDLTRSWADLAAEHDPRSLSLVCLWHSTLLRPFADVVDILAPDPYPGFPGGPMIRVSNSMIEAKRAVNGRQPVVAVLQAFGEPPGKVDAVLPTPAELRNMTYQALIQDARGVLYFSYSYNGPMREKQPKHWQELKRLANEMRDLTPALTSAAAGLEAVPVANAGPILTRVLADNNSRYILAVNPTRTPVTDVQWQLQGFQDGWLEAVGETRKLKLTNGRLNDSFKPLAVHVYRQAVR